jgi:hypothetical protein
MKLPAYQGGGRLVRLSAGVGAAGLALTLLGGLVFDGRRALFSYLVAFVYWVGIAVASLTLLEAFHAASARWPVVVRRFVETVPLTLPLFVVLFVPIALGMTQLFPWASPQALQGELARAVEHKLPYLNPRFFLVRAALYFAVWIVVAHLLRAWSVRQDTEGGVALTVRQRWLGTGSIPLVGLTFTFAVFDWVMSLDPRFYSTIFGLYVWAGSFLCAFALPVIAGWATRNDPTAFGHLMNADHFHSLGKYLLSFVAFWAYMAFSQLLLIWIANLPDEVPWYIVRIGGGWFGVAAFVGLFKFLVPFFLLLSRDLKRSPRALSYVAAWLLFVHWVDVYWLVMPHLDGAGPRPWIFDLTAFVGVGGVAIAMAVLRMRGAPAVPVGDPYLEDSLRYQPE